MVSGRSKQSLFVEVSYRAFRPRRLYVQPCRQEFFDHIAHLNGSPCFWRCVTVSILSLEAAFLKRKSLRSATRRRKREALPTTASKYFARKASLGLTANSASQLFPCMKEAELYLAAGRWYAKKAWRLLYSDLSNTDVDRKSIYGKD